MKDTGSSRAARGTDLRPAKSREELNEAFRSYVKDERSGDPERMRKAREGACRDLDLFVKEIVSRHFGVDAGKAPELFDELVQAGRMGITAYLAKYDPDRGMPTTCFYGPIKHEIAQQANQMRLATARHLAENKKKIAAALAR